MDLTTLVLGLAALACPIGMGLMIWMMSKNMRGQHSDSTTGDQLPTNPDKRLAALRKQRQALEAEIAEASRLAELEGQRDAVRNGQVAVPDDHAR